MVEGNYEKLILKTKEELAKEGNKEAFVDLINENRLVLYKISKGILRDDYKAEDAVSNSILKAFKSIKTLKNPEYFKTWLTRILINECNIILRTDKKIVYINEKKEGAYLDSYEEIDLMQAINSLDKEFREVTVLFYFQRLTQKEISEVLQINEGTVKTRLHRARKKLYEILK